MKDFELDVRYDSEIGEVSISGKGYDDWKTYLGIKSMKDLLEAIKDYIESQE